MLNSDLRSVMVEVDHSMWTGAPPPTIALRTLGATSAFINDVGELIALCEQARCGVNGKTVTDLSVRKTLRVAADRVSVVWPAMSTAVEDCAAHLGLGAGVTAQLHDVLVYRPGDFFKRHVDSIKHPRHCATMVVDTGLAVGRCVGGVLHVGDKPWVSFGAGSYAAWHTNAEHHVTELVSGHRVVAMYNLLRSEPVLPEVTHESPVQPAERMKAKQEVTVLKKYLEDNAAHYADSFTEADLSKADSLFVKYAKRRGESPVYIESSRATPKEEEDSWDARCRAPWDANNKPQEFVGFWLMRQYPSRDGIVRNSKLNGADADLVEAVAQQFGVPLWHIECRVVYHYEEGETAQGTKVESVFADFVEGVDDYPRDYYSIAPVAKNDDTEVDKKGEFDDDDDDDEGEDEKVSGLRAIDHEQDNYDQMYGHQYRKVAIVGGSCGGTSTYVGLNVGNDAGDPIYRYQDTYLYFHVKYLKDYLARQAATRSDSAELPCPASGVAKKRAREEEEEGNL